MPNSSRSKISFRDIAAVLKKKEEAAAVNGDGSRNGNGKVAMDNQQQQLGNDSLLPCICNLSSSFSFLRSWLWDESSVHSSKYKKWGST